MIKANELRVGNIVKINTGVDIIGVATVDCIEANPDRISVKETPPLWGYLDPSEIVPIELSYAWVEKLGFDNNCIIENDKWKFTAMFYDGWWISYKEKEGYGCSDCQIRGFYYVHEFQNLFFSLTGEELVFSTTEP